MDTNTKSLLKHTILSLIGGGAVASIYAASKNLTDKEDTIDDKGDIIVPLSKKHYMKSVSRQTAPSGKTTRGVTDKDLSSMSPKDLAELKKNILRKKANASDPTMIEETNIPAISVSKIRRSAKNNTAYIRNKNGRFSKATDFSKCAGSVSRDATGVVLDTAGTIGGFYAGLSIIKSITDRIKINRKKKLLEQSRKKYTDMLNNEVNDVDLPYYTSKSASDRSFRGNLLGAIATTGLGTATVAGLVVYKIMEKRRKEAERLADKDNSRYPEDKTIKFKFASANKKPLDFFR